MSRLRAFLFVVALALLVAAFAAACGDDDELTLEEYFQQLEADLEIADSKLVRVQMEFDASAEAAKTEEE